MYVEKEVIQKVKKFFIAKKYKILEQIKIRGRIVDVIAIKNKETALIEVKGGQGDILRGIAQAMHYHGCGNYVYLALPKEKLTKELKNTSKNLGIGIITVNKKTKQILRPKFTKSLESVRSTIFNFKPKEKKESIRKSHLERLFTSKARIKILELLIFKQEEFHIREISRRINISAPYVIKELNNLKEMNLVIESKKGNLKLYKINKSSPLYEPLKIMLMRTESLGSYLKNVLKNRNVKFALIYGSFASGKETEKSDIDLLIIGDVKQADIIDVISKFERKMLREINYILWNEREFKKRIKEKHHLLMNIIKKPVIMIIGDENEFRRTIK